MTSNVGLNAHLLNLSGSYRSAGISWYIYHLLQHLDAAPDLKYTAFLSEPRARTHFKQLAIIQSRWPTHRPIVRIAWEQIVQPFLLYRERIDLLHALAFAGPLAISIPWIATIYDLSFIRYPQSFNRANRVYLTWAIKNSLRRANRIIAISESTKRDLIAIDERAKDKITVVYCGRNPNLTIEKDKAKIDALRTRRQLPDKMILFIGTIEPRKNIARLIRAFAHAKRTAHLPHRLVLGGARGWKYAEVDAAIEQTGIADDVIFAGYVPEDELPLWHQAADLFVYPSIYEGFGLPPLDAMSCGTPVVTSNVSSLPEVVGDAAIQVSPDDETALSNAIVCALTNPTQRTQMIERGLAQAAKFSWARAGRETTALYRQVLQPGNCKGATDA